MPLKVLASLSWGVLIVIKVITTVGASLFTNYLDVNKDIEIHYKNIKEKPFNEYHNLQDRIKQIKAKVTPWAAKNIGASAEIKSLWKIHEFLKQPLDVYLIATDTVVSALAAEIIKTRFDGEPGFTVHFKDTDVITGLQVKDYQLFVREGLPKLVYRIEEITANYHGEVIFNIAGGYKGVIPYMTVMALVNNWSIYYIFEESQTVIEIPKAPIKINYDVFEKYSREINMLRDVVENYNRVRSKNFLTFTELEKMGLVETDDGMAFLSPLGVIFHEKYRQRFYNFYCTDEVWEEIQNQKDIQRIITEKFANKTIRESKTEIKGVHTVFDDGDNQNRIYYFQHEGGTYVHKTFQNEEAARKFIDSTLNKGEVTKKAKMRKWGLKNV